MTIRQLLTDDQDGTTIQPGSFRIHAAFTWNIPGTATPKTGELDFSSFDNLLAYVQAQKAAYEAATAPPPPTAAA